VRLPSFLRSREERDSARFENGRQGAFARGMREAAARDGVTRGNWRPGPAPRPRQARRRDQQLRHQRSDPRREGTGRAETLARATQQQARGRTR